jgi:hypothetical protein
MCCLMLQLLKACLLAFAVLALAMPLAGRSLQYHGSIAFVDLSAGQRQ